MLAPSTYPLGAAFLAGVTYGFAYCGPSCGPFLCTYIMGSDGGSASALRSLAVFSAARVLTYAAAGAASALLGTAVVALQGSSSVVLGIAVVVTGALMWRQPSQGGGSGESGCGGRSGPSCAARGCGGRAAPPLWLAGIAFALTPCPPMLALLACAANAGSPALGAGIMLLFGLGTALSPLLLISVLAGHCSGRLRRLAPQHTLLFRRTASLTLVALGCAMLLPGG